MKRKYFSVLLPVVLVVASVSFLTSCKDYTNDISNLQAQVDKAALSTDVQTLKAQVEANAQKELATADTAKKAFDKAVANAAAISSNSAAIGGNSAAINGNSAAISGNTAKIEAINKSLDNMNTTIQSNAEKAASRIDSLARAGAVTDAEIAKLQSATKAAADSAAYAILKNKELFGELADLVGKVGNISDNVSNISGNLTNLSGEVKNIQNTLTKWAEAKNGYYTATEIDKKLDDLASEIQNALDDSIANLKKTVVGYQATVNALYTAVTSVSLYINSETDAKNAFRLKFVKGKVQNNYIFGKEEKDDVDTTYTATPICDYKKSTSFCIPRILRVRVNPVNAKLTPDMIKLIDSEGNSLDDVLEVTSVEKYGGLLTKASMGTGLWTVRLKLKEDIDNSLADKKDPSGTKHIAYALAVNNTDSQSDAISDAAGRYVVSSYDITVEGMQAYSKATSLDGVKICNETGKMDATAWKTLGELRTDQAVSKAIYAYDGENILMDFSQYADSIDRFYVAVDYGHSTVAGTDMRNYWKSYDYSGVNTVYEVNTDIDTKFGVKIGKIANNLIKMRIFAVNYDGSLVEDHGVSFEVNIGPKVTEASVEGDLVATTTAGKMETGWLPISGTLTNSGNLSGQIAFSGNDGNEVHPIIGTVTYASDTNGTSIGGDLSKAKYVKIAISDSLQYWTDGTSLYAILQGGDDPVVINRISVKLKKVMPTVEDAIKIMGYKRNFSNDTYIAYMESASWDNSKNCYYVNWAFNGSHAKIGIDQAFDKAITVDNKSDKNAKISIENAAPNSQDNNKYSSPLILNADDNTKSPWDLVIDAEHDNDGTLTDGKTPHKAEVYYNYGKISSEIDDNGNYIDSYKVIVDSFQIIFSCMFDESVQKYEWIQTAATESQPGLDVNVLTYGNTSTVGQYVINRYINGKNSVNSGFYSYSLSYLCSSGGTQVGMYSSISAHLYIKGTTTEPYFTVWFPHLWQMAFRLVEGSTPPLEDVNCTLHIEPKDAFGHTHKYDLPFLVKKP